MVKRIAWFSVTIVTNSSGNYSLLFNCLNYCVVVATCSIVYVAYAKIEYVSLPTYPSKMEYVGYVSSSRGLEYLHESVIVSVEWCCVVYIFIVFIFRFYGTLFYSAVMWLLLYVLFLPLFCRFFDRC